MENLMKLFTAYAMRKQSLVIEITWDKVADWTIYICHRDSNTVIFDENWPSLHFGCARAFEKLAEWGKEYEDLEDLLYNIF
jgi:hypothetical protein